MRARCALEHHLVRFDADDEEVAPRPDRAQQPVHEQLRTVAPVQLGAAQQVVPTTNNAAAETLMIHGVGQVVTQLTLRKCLPVSFIGNQVFLKWSYNANKNKIEHFKSRQDGDHEKL